MWRRSLYGAIGARGAGAAAFSPLDLSPTAWYDPSDLSTLFQDSAGTTPVTADGDVVGLMQDKSGNGFHLTQATAANKPLYKTAGGLHWLQHDGVDDVIVSAGGTLWSQPNDIVTGVRGMEAAVGYVFDGAVSPNRHYCFYQPTSSLWAYGVAGQISTSANSYVVDEDAVLNVTYNGASGGFRKNAVSIGTGNTGVVSMEGVRLGGGTGGSNGFSRNYGFLIFNRLLSASDRTAIETWMASKSGVTL